MVEAQQSAHAAKAAGSVLARHIAAKAAERAAAGRRPAEVPLPAPVARTPERAASGAIARAAERVHGLPLFFEKVVTSHAVIAELSELIPDQALISVVEGAREALGAVMMCPGLLTSVIEMQAMGRISSRPATTRRPTRTDAAICSDFINACLSEVGTELAGHVGYEGLSGYRYANFLDDPRLLEMMLEEVTYRLISVSLRAGPAGQRDGQMVILLPVAPAPNAAAISGPDAPAAPAATGILAEHVETVPIELIGVLCRRMISLGELQSLSPGSTLSLPPGVLTQATLETTTGQTLFRGKVGEHSGRHALRLTNMNDARASGMSDAGSIDRQTKRSAEVEEGAWDFAAEADFAQDGGMGGAYSEPGPLDFGIDVEPPMADLDADDEFRMPTFGEEAGIEIGQLGGLTAASAPDSDVETADEPAFPSLLSL